MSESGEVHAGAIINLTALGDGVWRAEQVDIAQNLPPTNVESRIPIEWGFGPIRIAQMNGYLDTNTLELGVSNSIAGINVGTIYGDLRDGVGLYIGLSAAKGSIKWYLKNGNELWTTPDISTSTSQTFSRDFKIFAF